MMRYLSSRRNVADLLALIILLILDVVLMGWAYRGWHVAHWEMDTPPAAIPQQGFYQLERWSDHPGVYRWTNGSGRIKVPNPGGTAVLQVTLAGGPGRSVPVRMHLGGVSTNFSVTPEPRNYTFVVPASSGERLSVQIDSPVTIVRNRDLGVVVGDGYISGGREVAAAVLLALLAATIGLFVLVRQAGLATLPASGLVALSQGAAVIWQAAGAWRYGLFGSLMLLVAGSCLAPSVLSRFCSSHSAPQAPAPRLSRLDFRLIGVVLLAAVCVRLPWLTAFDPVGDLELNARRMGYLHAGGLAGAFTAQGDLLPAFLYLLALLGRFVPPLGGSFAAPLPAVTLILLKLPNLCADLVTAVLIYVWSRRWASSRRAAVIAALYTLAPPVWINVAWWGQHDALLMLALVAMVVLLPRSGGRWSWVCWSVALLTKPQAIVLAPLLYAATLRLHGRRGLLQGGALAGGLFAAGCAPLVIAGQGPGLLEAYLGSVGRFPKLTNGAYNLWFLLTRGNSGADIGQGFGPISFHLVGLALTGLAAILVSLAMLRCADGPARTEGAAVLALSFFLLPTQIHERYLFLTLAFLALSLARRPRLMPIYVAVVISATLNILGTLSAFVPSIYRYMTASPTPLAIAVLNLLMLAGLMGHLWSVTLRLDPSARFSLAPTQR